MTDRMKKFMTRAASKIGTPSNMYNEYKEASKNGWIVSAGYPQNSMTMRYVATEKGLAAMQ